MSGRETGGPIRVLLVDDDEDDYVLTRGLFSEIEGASYKLDWVSTLDAGAKAIARAEHDVYLVDYRLGRASGLTLIRRAQEAPRRAPFIVLSVLGDRAVDIEAMKAGAADYLVKGQITPSLLERSIRYALERSARERIEEKVAVLEEQTKNRAAFARLVGNSAPMQEVFRRLRLASSSDVSVLLLGDSGTGKELAAAAIHSLSRRRDGPFLTMNCGAIPDALLESELFGHVRGAFTGAVLDRIGLFQAAHGGTLFLDEIADTSPLFQQKLLRALEEREVRPVGSHRTVKVDVRFLAATNKPLERLVRSGEFREDLYYRIRVFEIGMPPLRERREDIPLLVERFLEDLAAPSGGKVATVSQDALRKLMDYPWPGNVRELKNAIEHASVTLKGGAVRLGDLPAEIRSAEVAAPSSKKASQDEERLRVLSALKTAGGSRTDAARQLGISRVGLWKKMRRLGIELSK
ncbi:sigma-54-dependent Fis family transcriptional regulator [bacterium]|nr:sigma-54-dependent Fis family transcriptional regulator [bacterium]